MTPEDVRDRCRAGRACDLGELSESRSGPTLAWQSCDEGCPGPVRSTTSFWPSFLAVRRSNCSFGPPNQIDRNLGLRMTRPTRRHRLDVAKQDSKVGACLGAMIDHDGLATDGMPAAWIRRVLSALKDSITWRLHEALPRKP